MESFYIIVIIIASIFLVLLLGYIGVSLAKPGTSITTYPPINNTCPDLWVVDKNQNCVIPTNGNNLGTFSASVASSLNTPGLVGTTINPNDPAWSTGSSAVCSKKLWANTYNIQWDGITNYNSC
jgi:hypothetical protein